MGVYIWNRLPSEYQEVEYIGRNGNNYIDTGWIPKLTGGFTIKVGYKISTSSRRYAIIGNYNDISNDISLEISNSNTARFYIQNTGSFNLYSSNTINTSSFNDITYTISTISQSINLNGTTTSSSTSLPETNNTSCYLFIDRQKRWTTFTANSFISYCKIYESGTLVRDFIPCYRKSDSVIGLYDLVNNQFYTNSGTGTFSKGNDVTMVEMKNAYIGEVWTPGSNTIAYRPLESNANDIVGGYSGTSISGISYDTLASGKKVAKITSSTSNISISGSIAGIIGSGDYTISYWIYMTGAVLSQVGLMFWVGTNSSPYSGPQILLDVEGRWSAGALRFSTQYGNGVSSSSKSLLNKWHYITFTRESGACKGYIDGVLEGSFTSSTTFSSGNVGWLFARGTSNQCLASNSMGSEFILENKSRTAQEISHYFDITKSNYGL